MSNNKKEHNKVSVVIPVRNREKKITRSVNSALNQTHENIEVVVIDDGSEDKTYEVVSRIKDERLRVIGLGIRHGVSRARNIGIEESTGEFIAFLDSDDEWVEDKIEKQMSYIKNYEGRVDIVDCDWDVRDENLGVELTKSQNGPTSKQQLLAFQHICSPPTVIARRTALKEVGAFDESISTAEDADLWVRMSQKYEFGHVPEVLVKVYRGHRGRIGRNLQPFLSGHLRFYVKHRDKYKGKNKIKAKFFEKIGHKLILIDEPLRGRKYICKSIQIYPFYISQYMILVLSFLSRENYNNMRYIKNRLLKICRKVSWE